MMRRLLSILVLVLLGSTFATAQDTVDPVNPNQNEQANACFEDGTMAGKCNTNWAWTCGWYLLRYEYGLLPRENFPTWCPGLLHELSKRVVNDLDEQANACFEGGTMAGKCNTNWAWTCGWYIIRYNAGIFSRSAVPATCASLLPAENETVTVQANPLTWPPAGCYYSPVYLLWIYWNGNQTQPPPINMTWEVPCGVPTTGVGGFSMVSAADAASAAALCAASGYNYIDEISPASNTGAWAIYRCQVP